jgi:hypothetical protein
MTTKKSSIAGLWAYIKERENIRLRKEAGQPWPWTKDKILQSGKFTNVQREYDRTTKEFHSVFSHHYRTAPPEVLLLNCAIARWFGTAEFYHSLGWQSSFNAYVLESAANARMAAGRAVFTRAYVITNGGQSIPKTEYVSHKVLASLWFRAKGVVERIDQTRTWRAGYDQLRHAEGHGGTGFMAKEVLLDYITYVPALVDRYGWTPVGPGAMRGLGRILAQDPNAKAKDPLDTILLILDKVGPWWQEMSYGQRALSAHDIQFCLCEYDKYERVRLGEGKMKNQYERKEK